MMSMFLSVRSYVGCFVKFQNFITKITKDLSTILYSFAAPEEQDSTRAVGTFELLHISTFMSFYQFVN